MRCFLIGVVIRRIVANILSDAIPPLVACAILGIFHASAGCEISSVCDRGRLFVCCVCVYCFDDVGALALLLRFGFHLADGFVVCMFLLLAHGVQYDYADSVEMFHR